LLTCQSGRFIDNSTNNFTVSLNGSPSVQTYNPFYTASIASNGGSMYFDGSGDYLTSPTNAAFDFGSSNFTIEGWYYFTNSTANALQTLYTNYTSFSSAGSIFYGKHTNNSGYMTVWFSNYSTGGPLLAETSYPPNNSWVHYALVRNGNTFTLYRNGVSTASASWSGAATSGACPAFIGAAGDNVNAYNFPGYMNGFRITKGTAVYTSAFTPPTAPVTPTANTTLLVNGMNAGAYDATTINDMETVGDAKVSTAVSKFGGSSMYFDGTGDWLTTPSSSSFNLSSGNWTVEGWYYPTAYSGSNNVIFYLGASSGDKLVVATIGTSGYLYYLLNGSVVVSSTTAGSLNTWSHFALVKNGSTTTLYLNGTSLGTTTSVPTSSSKSLTIGTDAGGAVYQGYIDDFRVTNGVARYTANFTPPTAAFPVY
jgi:hypothetical protein